MKASTLYERNQYISIASANVNRKSLCRYLKSLKETAIDIFHGNHAIDDLDAIFLEDTDYGTAFNTACAVMSYKLLSIYGASCEIRDECIFSSFSFKDCEDGDVNSFMCCELAYEYGRQLHYIICLYK